MLKLSNNRKILTTVAIANLSFFIVLTVLAGCKQKEQPSETRQPSSAENVQQSAKSESEAAEKSAMKILYAGHPGSEREKDFVEFLAKHFEKVESGDLKEIKDSDAEGFDVIIFDYDGDGFNSPRPGLSPAFSKPALTMGVTGAFICGSRNLKTGYL